MLKVTRSQVQSYSVAVFAVALALLLTKLLEPVLVQSIFLLFIAAVAITTWYGGMKPGLLATVLSVLATSYFFLPPIDSLAIGSANNALRLLMFVLVTLSIGTLNASLRNANQQLESSLLKLQTSEVRWRGLFESNLMGILYFDLKGNLLEANDAFLKLVGYTREDLLQGKIPLLEMTPPEYHSLNQRAKEELLTVGKCTSFEKEYICKNGSRVPILIESTLLEGKPDIGVAFVLDLTKRKQAKEVERRLIASLQASESQLRLITDSLPALISYVDSEQRYRFNNKAYEDWFGHSRSQIYGKHIREVLGESAYEAVRPQVEAVLSGQNLYWERILPYKEGGSRYVSVAYVPDVREVGDVRGYVALVQDITARKEAEEAKTRLIASLQASEERFRQMAETIENVFWMSDPINNQLLYVSPAYEKIWGRSCESLYANFREWMESIHPEDRNRVQTNFFQQVYQGQYDEEFRVVRPDGTICWVRDRGFPIRDATGVVKRVAGIAEDITQRKQAQAQIEQLNESLELRVKERTAQLEAANQELESFSYSVSHDLRAPIRHISGFVELLQKRAAANLDETSQRYLNIITDTSKQAGILIDDLLAFSRMGRAEMRHATVNMDRLVQEIQREIDRETKDRPIVWQIETLPEVQGDPAMLRLVIRNLMENAVKYAGKRDRPEITIGSIDNGTEIIYFIRDNGVGFDMKYAHKLFGIFQRLHSAEQFQGTGIGLANVRRIVHRHKGKTWAEGIVDGGATFYFSLPKLAQKEVKSES